MPGVVRGLRFPTPGIKNHAIRQTVYDVYQGYKARQDSGEHRLTGRYALKITNPQSAFQQQVKTGSGHNHPELPAAQPCHDAPCHPEAMQQRAADGQKSTPEPKKETGRQRITADCEFPPKHLFHPADDAAQGHKRIRR